MRLRFERWGLFGICPSKLHYLFLGEWQAAFPGANLWATAATIAKCSELRFSGVLADHPPAEWDGQVDQFYLPIRLSWTN